jgi:hypothetical protein
MRDVRSSCRRSSSEASPSASAASRFARYHADAAPMKAARFSLVGSMFPGTSRFVWM